MEAAEEEKGRTSRLSVIQNSVKTKEELHLFQLMPGLIR